MSQHDYDIANQSGAAFRSDVNALAAAIASLNAGASAPGTTVAYQPWADTTNGLFKQRNAANTAWLVRQTLAESFVLSRSSNTILGVADWGRTFIATASFTQTFTAVATLGDGWHCWIINASTGNLTLDPNSTEQIDGANTLVLRPGESCKVECNGSALRTVGLTPVLGKGADVASASTINLDAATGRLVDVTGTTAITAITLAEGEEAITRFTGALTLTNGASLVLLGGADIATAAGDIAVWVGYAAGVVRMVSFSRAGVLPTGRKLGSAVSLSGTTVEISGAIPAWVNEIDLIIDQGSSNGTSAWLVQIGDSGGYETTGYASNSGLIVGTGSVGVTSSSAGFAIRAIAATFSVSGKITLTRKDATTWVQSHALDGGTSGPWAIVGGGSKALSATLDRLRFTTVGGTDSFDAGDVTMILKA